jgi:hypothetical protein
MVKNRILQVCYTVTAWLILWIVITQLRQNRQSTAENRALTTHLLRMAVHTNAIVSGMRQRGHGDA